MILVAPCAKKMPWNFSLIALIGRMINSVRAEARNEINYCKQIFLQACCRGVCNPLAQVTVVYFCSNLLSGLNVDQLCLASQPKGEGIPSDALMRWPEVPSNFPLVWEKNTGIPRNQLKDREKELYTSLPSIDVEVCSSGVLMVSQ